jgi:hypothetical protein
MVRNRQGKALPGHHTTNSPSAQSRHRTDGVESLVVCLSTSRTYSLTTSTWEGRENNILRGPQGTSRGPVQAGPRERLVDHVSSQMSVLARVMAARLRPGCLS